MKGDIAVRSISASISLCAALSAPRTICSVTGSDKVARSPACIASGMHHLSLVQRILEIGTAGVGRVDFKVFSRPNARGQRAVHRGMSEERVVGAVSADEVRGHVERITTTIPSRLAGSENGRRMAEYSAAALTKAGVPARVFEMPGLVSFPEPAEMRVVAPIDVASGAFHEYEGRSAVGKITLSELSYHPARHEKQRISALMGATGCVMMNWGHPENTAVPFGSVKPVWGNPTPETYRTEMATLPCVGIARTAGLKLREMLKSGPVRVWFRANVENGWRPVQITVGEIEGQTNDFVVVGGHQDSWPGPQATDNAAGNACVMELARVFAQ